MQSTDVVVVGAGQAGLAMSWWLTRTGIDHLVLESRRIAASWRDSRWDSLRLLTPNWIIRLPGWRHHGDDPDGFMSKDGFAELLARYAAAFAAPVVESCATLSVTRSLSGFVVDTTHGPLHAKAVVLATGACARARLPAAALGLPRGIRRLSALDYRRPEDVADGGVLVVGASASGAQIAEELRLAGREVTLAVGSHTWLPRRYRGRDVMAWLDAAGILGERSDRVGDLAAARRQPSLQLVGRSQGPGIGLASLAENGVCLAGRLSRITGRTAVFEDDLPASRAAAARRLERTLSRIDAWAEACGAAADPDARAAAMEAFAGGRDPAAAAVGRLDLARVRTVLFATGYRPLQPQLRIRGLPADGDIRHDEGVTGCPGLYVLGLPFQRTRKSTFIDGVGADAEALMAPLLRHLGAAPLSLAG